jgi:type II secretory pathway component PulK
MKQTRSTTIGGRRRGAVLVMVLVCTLVAIGLVASGLQLTLRTQRRQTVLRQRYQTRLLLEAGIGLAQNRLAADEDYSGETWNAGEAFAQYRSARVTIAMPATDSSEQKRVLVTARIERGDSPTNAMQLSHQFIWTPPNDSSEEN